MTKVDYDRISQIYDLVREGQSDIIKSILDAKSVNEDSAILEIGCGTGNNTLLMSKVTNARVIGMDQSEGMLEKARAKSDDINFFQGDAVTLKSFADGEFDIVYMVDVIHHIKDIKTMLSNINRVLKKDGMVFVFTNSHDYIKNCRLTSKYFPDTIEAELKRYQDGWEIEAAMRETGFSNVGSRYVEYPTIKDAGSQLIALAEKKGYSMFHLIAQEAIDKGIEKIKEDMEKGSVDYYPKDLLVSGQK